MYLGVYLAGYILDVDFLKWLYRFCIFFLYIAASRTCPSRQMVCTALQKIINQKQENSFLCQITPAVIMEFLPFINFIFGKFPALNPAAERRKANCVKEQQVRRDAKTEQTSLFPLLCGFCDPKNFTEMGLHL